MKAMILAAGRGKRMMPLTAKTPKPLLEVAGKPLLQHHIERLRDAGINQLVINHCYLGQQLEDYFGNGERFGISIIWSPEEQALETAGGIRKALPLLGDQPFLLVNGDIWCDIDFNLLQASEPLNSLIKGDRLAHLCLVKNPPQNLQGDFGLCDGLLHNDTADKLTYTGVGLYHPKLLQQCKYGQAHPLAPILRKAIDAKQISGEKHHGEWRDIGTPERLAQLEKHLSNAKATINGNGSQEY